MNEYGVMLKDPRGKLKLWIAEQMKAGPVFLMRKPKPKPPPRLDGGALIYDDKAVRAALKEARKLHTHRVKTAHFNGGNYAGR